MFRPTHVRDISGSGVLSVARFSPPLRAAVAVACCLFLGQFLWTPLEASPKPRQIRPTGAVTPVQAKGATLSREFSFAGADKLVVELKIAGPGKIRARAVWTGTAASLALILNGPGMTQAYARRDGSSPLSLEFDLTDELAARGSDWRLSVVGFQSGAAARGTLTVELPAAPSISPVDQAQAPAAKAQTTPSAAQAQASGEKAQTQTAATTEKAAARPEVKAIPQDARPVRTGLKGSASLKKVEPAGTDEDVTPLREFMEQRIGEICRSNELGGLFVPIFFKYLEEVAADPGLLKQYYRSSAHRKGQTQRDFDLHFHRVVKAYREIPQDFKARHFVAGYAQMGRGTRLDLKRLGADIVQKTRPSLGPEIKRLAQEAFSGRFLVPADKVSLTDVPMERRGTRPAAKVQPRTATPPARLAAVDSLVGRGAGLRSESRLAELRDTLRQAGADIPELAVQSAFVRTFFPDPSTLRTLPSIDGKTSSVDYYRYKITLDWFHCLNKNETTNDEPYFGLITMLPQFDASDTSFFKYLKDGCLDWTSSYTTRTYGGVGRGEEHGLKGEDRVVFDYLTFNSPASFTIQLWEEDYSKGSVADGLRLAAMDIMRRIQSDIKAAIISQVQAYIADAILSLGGGIDSSGALRLLEQIFPGGLSPADFQSMLYNLYSGRAFDASWYLVYFLFSGGDFLQTLAMIGGGSTVMGAIFLGLAVFGPAIADMFEGFFAGDIGKGLWNLFKILTVIPLIIDLFKRMFTSLSSFFRGLMAWLDPDDFLGERTIVIERTSPDWQNDARDGEWSRGRMGGVKATEADAHFKRRGFGPTRDNSSFLWENIFWVPVINFKKEVTMPLWNWSQRTSWGGATVTGWMGAPPQQTGPTQTYVASEYNVMYQVKREVAGGRTTYGYWFPSTPALGSKIITYKGKSSPDAWWTNIIRVTVMSLTTDKAPWAVLVDEKTGRSFYSLSGPVFELEADPGADYTLYLLKLGEGETAGYVSIYEGPVINVQCPPPGSSVKSPSGGSSGGNPPGSGRARQHLK